MSQPPRTLHIYDKGSIYNILDNDDKTCLYTARFSKHTSFNLIAIRSPGPSQMVGRVVYHVTKRFNLIKTMHINLCDTPAPGAVPLNKEGRLFANKRVLHTPALGTVHLRSRVADNPWRAGATETTFVGCIDGDGRDLAEYREEGYDVKRMGRLEIKAELGQEAFDEMVLSAMAVILVVKAL